MSVDSAKSSSSAVSLSGGLLTSPVTSLSHTYPEAESSVFSLLGNSSLNSSGLGTASTEGLTESGEQKDINALIQK